MIRAFQCTCGDYDFEILTENNPHSDNKDKTYFRCTGCGEDYQWEEVNSIDKQSFFKKNKTTNKGAFRMNQNGQHFIKELEQLCVKYNVSIYAGMYGLKFNFTNEEDKENGNEYYNQNLNTKEFIVSE